MEVTFRSSAILRPAPLLLFPLAQLKHKAGERSVREEAASAKLSDCSVSLMQPKLKLVGEAEAGRGAGRPGCCFLPALDLPMAYISSMRRGERGKKKRKCGNDYSKGDMGGISFGSLFGLFWPIYSFSCLWRRNTDCLQMMCEVYEQNVPLIYSALKEHSAITQTFLTPGPSGVACLRH